MAQHYVATKDLPQALQTALKCLDYHRPDIEVKSAPTISPIVYGDKGSRGFVTMVNLETGLRETKMGSWGGANMFNPDNQVDLDEADYTIPLNVAVIKGTQGYPKTYATITVSPDNIGRFLPVSDVTVTPKEAKILGIYASLKSFARKDYLDRLGAVSAEVDTLVARGLLSRNKAGATSITTQGRNLADKRI